MSNFINNIECKLRYNEDRLLKQNIPELSCAVKIQDFAAISSSFLKGYRAEVRYSVDFYCMSAEVEHQLQLVKKQLQIEIYGEFWRKLIELKRSIYSDERDTALHICDELFKEIEE